MESALANRRSQRTKTIMPGPQNFPLVHLDDVTQIRTHALGNSDVEGVIDGVAPQKLTSKKFAQNFGSVLRSINLNISHQNMTNFY